MHAIYPPVTGKLEKSILTNPSFIWCHFQIIELYGRLKMNCRALVNQLERTQRVSLRNQGIVLK
jgi:hypothetical protein